MIHSCTLHVAGDWRCRRDHECVCFECSEAWRHHKRGSRPAAPEKYMQDLSDGNCAGVMSFTEMPEVAQYRACITCPVMAICPQPTPWPRGECCREGHDSEHLNQQSGRCRECIRERDRLRRQIERARASERAA